MTDPDQSFRLGHELNYWRALKTDAASDDALRVRQLLHRANYTEQGLRGAGLGSSPDPHTRDPQAMARALNADGLLSTLIRVFFLGLDEDRGTPERLLEGEYEAFVGLGLAERHGRHLRAALQLTPWAGLVLAHDAAWQVRRRDHVLGPGRSSATLAQLTVRRDVSAALDLGAGCGVQALLIARHARRVVAADVNPRALALTALNALLNDVPNVEVRTGDLFEGLSGERFNLIVSNPPFVISPDRKFLFRDSTLPRDEISRSVVAQAAPHLDAAGFATVMVNWIQAAGEAWRDAPTRWVNGTGCDALLIHYSTEDPQTYAARWSTQLRDSQQGRQRMAIDRWSAYYRNEGIEAIASGAIVLRRAAGMPWVHAMHLESGSSMRAGEHIQSIFAARDYLAALAGDDLMLGHEIRMANGTEFEGGGTVLVRREGLGVRGRYPIWFADVLRRLDGTRTLGEISDEVARETGSDAAARRSEAVPTVRDLLERGFLEQGSMPNHAQAGPQLDLAAGVDSDS